MTITAKEIAFQTNGNYDVLDITLQVSREVEKSGVSDGIVTLFICGSTAGITTIEYEPGLIKDFGDMWDRIVPQGMPYEHDKAWGDGNGHSHVRASMLGASLTIPVVNKKLTLGTWQQIIFVDFDNRPRSRKILLQFMGD